LTQIAIKINDGKLLATFADTIAKLEDLTPMMADVGEYMQRRIDDGFRYERDPYGQSWAPLAASTLKQKTRQKRILKILQSRGTMRGTLTYQARRDRVLIGFNVFYADFHQRGTKRMVKRQLLPDVERGLPAQDVAQIQAIAQDHFSYLVRR